MDKRISRRDLLKVLITSAVLAGCRAIGGNPSNSTQQLGTSSTEPPVQQATDDTNTQGTQPEVSLPETVISPTHEPIPISSKIVAISAGGSHSLALTADGKVWGWGNASNLGLQGDFLPVPTKLDLIED